MAAVYYEKIDVEGHHYGPLSSQVKTAVQKLDIAFQTLNQKITVRPWILFQNNGEGKEKSGVRFCKDSTNSMRLIRRDAEVGSN